MPFEARGDATGESIGNGLGEQIHFGVDGTIIVQLANGKTLQFQDSAGNLLTQMDASTRNAMCLKLPLAALDAAGGVLSWQNPFAVSIVIDRLQLDVTTKATAACTLDAGTTAVNAATASDNLIDGVDVGTAAGLFGKDDQAGANGKAAQKLASGKWVTISKDTGAAAGLVGNAYLFFHLA